MLIRLFKRFRASIYWVSSLNLASREEYEKALQKIIKIEKNFPDKVEVTLFKGYLLFATDRDDLALRTLLNATDLIDKSSKYNPEEKKYLLCYASLFGEKLTDSRTDNKKYPFKVDFEAVDLKKVRRALKDNYPLRAHPYWVD